MKKILSGVNHIHTQDVIHRDLKPDNILIDRETEEPILVDFGLSKDYKDSTIVLRSMVGSKIFMAPEIVEGSAHSYPCDVWSLGLFCT